jgi:hypothetical protein
MANMNSMQSDTGIGKYISRSKTTGSPGTQSGRRCRGRSTCGSIPSSSIWTRRPTRFTSERSFWTIMPAGYILKQHLESFKEFPPRQTPADFNPGELLEHILKTAATGV